MNSWKSLIILLIPASLQAQTLPEFEILLTQATTLDVANNRQSWDMMYINRIKNEIRTCTLTLSRNSDGHSVFSGRCTTSYNETSAGNLKDSLVSVTPSYTPKGIKSTPSSEAINTGYVLEQLWLLDTKSGNVQFCWFGGGFRCHSVTDNMQTFNYYG
ncbi:hypothetical protein HQH16_19590 [Raoultella ornithinolytica]|uniref:hypothetical protein n=1 Tax=Raoultella ornithinolytica TaxID=54291 RepID=UPI0019157228|nr:hypothetical protein [Raoultella ornithinolytica]QQO50395.1 hypothetical protein HQH16_19590 [Raoultella ornithinolytica]